MLTTEQEKAIKLSMQLDGHKILKINALAGTGKTTTLINITKANIDKKYLYLAFNKALVEEAKKKFGDNVEIMTIHSLAYRHYAKILKIYDGNYDPATIKKALKIKERDYLISKEALRLFISYCNSNEKNIEDVYIEHQYKSQNVFLDNNMEKAIIKYAKAIYSNMSNGTLEVTHDYYLKRFSLDQVAIDYISDSYDGFLLDEAQDSNPVMLSIFQSFQGEKILVGDAYQQIYRFRGSTNAMLSVVSDFDIFLTTTFRCSLSVVDKANEVLDRYLGSKNLLVSKASENYDQNDVVFIGRTNASLIELIEKLIKKGTRFNTTRPVKEVFKLPINIVNYANKQYEYLADEFKHFLGFDGIEHLKDYAKDNDLYELSTAIRIAERYKKYLLVLQKEAIALIDKKSLVTITSAHSSKGLEWSNVFLLWDFPDLDEVKTLEAMKDEANLRYVAITRAKKTVVELGREDDEDEQ